jgi:hypothetical protein
MRYDLLANLLRLIQIAAAVRTMRKVQQLR